MYDKDEINAISILYSIDPTEENFDMLLKALVPLIDKILLNYPQIEEHWEDIKQEMLLRFWGNYKDADKLKKIFEQNIPLYYFYFVIRGYIFRMIKSILKGYDMYDENIKSFEELSLRQRQRMGIDIFKEKYEKFIK